MAYYRRYRKSYRPRGYSYSGKSNYLGKRGWRQNFKMRPSYVNRKKQNIYQFTKFVNKGVVIGANGTSVTAGSFTFKISDINGWSNDFQTAYDQFRIKAIKISFIPVANVTNITTVDKADERTTYYSRIFTAFDPNDSTAPTSSNQLREYKNAKWTPNNVIHNRFIYPKVLTAVNEGNNTYGTAETRGSPWINMSSNQTQYFALKYTIDHPPLSADHELYAVECKYYIQLKNYN